MRKAEATKQKITCAAIRLFVKKGVAETTTKDIARSANVSEGIIYRYFPGKEEMAQEIFLEFYRSLAAGLAHAQANECGLAAKTRAIVKHYCDAADADWELFAYHLLVQHRYLSQINGRDQASNPVNVLRTIIGDAIRAEEIPSGNVDLMTNMAIGIVLQPCIAKAFGRDIGNLVDHVDTFSDAILRALIAR